MKFGPGNIGLPYFESVRTWTPKRELRIGCEMNRHQFEQAAKHFRAGRLTLSDFSDQVFAGREKNESKTGTIATGAKSKTADSEMAMPNRRIDAHKGDFGRVLVIGGSKSMPGAIGLTGLAALRSGSGLVIVATENEVAPIVAGYSPCYMTMGIENANRREQLAEQLDWADVVAIGPGMGRSEQTRAFVCDLFKSLDQPMVIDADGLNCLADAQVDLADHTGQRILTPHPGEFRTLTGQSSSSREQVEKAANELAREMKLTVVLKGHNTISTDGNECVTNKTGNPGMATGGSGDVLTGIVASLIGQGLPALQAAVTAVKVHGLAGDLAAHEIGQTSLISSDLIDFLPDAFLKMK